MNISPMMIKAMFSALGVSPEEVMTPIISAVQDIQEFKSTAHRIEQHLIDIKLQLGMDLIDIPSAPSFSHVTIEHVQEGIFSEQN